MDFDKVIAEKVTPLMRRGWEIFGFVPFNVLIFFPCLNPIVGEEKC